VSMIVVGGIGTVWGPLLGAALLMLADEAMREAGDWRDIGLGVILAGFVILLPRGLAGVTFYVLRRGRRPLAKAKPAP
jgi:branched-chain amino acid transport system permease protein